MKNHRPVFTIMLLFTMVHLFSQSNSVFVVIDEIAEDVTRLKAEFINQPNVYVTDGSTPHALSQISANIENLQIDDLHIYASTKPGAIVFNSIAITSDNVDDLSENLKALGRIVTNMVVIHSDVVFSGEEGILLKQRLEEITGLVFTTPNEIK